MSFNARKVEGNQPRTPPMESGTYPARFVMLVDMGLQPRSFRGEAKEPGREIQLTYEMLDEFLLDEDGQEMPDKPRWISETMTLYNLDSEKANSTARYYALDPNEDAGGDFAELLGRPIMVTVVQDPPKADGKVYANVAGISQMRAKDIDKTTKLINAPRVFDLDSPDLEVWEKLPRWVQERIKSGLEWKGSKLESMLDVPFEGAGEGAKEATESSDNPY